MALDLQDQVYELVNDFPEVERFNLRTQIVRAATSIGLNIAEGSTVDRGQQTADRGQQTQNDRGRLSEEGYDTVTVFPGAPCS